MPHTVDAPPRYSDIHFSEFVALIATMMALTALSIDIMLVALPDITRDLGVAEPNQQQFMITAYLLGFALGQPLYGPLSDRFGRKPMLALGLVIFAIGALCAVWANSFSLMMAARGLQGFGAASPRIVGFAIVRDRFSGRHMARVMSFVMMVFIIVPIFAPVVGQAILRFGQWHWVFVFLFLSGAGALAWAMLRLPETRALEHRTPLSIRGLWWAFTTVLRTRTTLGYSIATGFMFGGLMSYVGSAQQIFVDAYHLGPLFPVAFGAVASVLALASLTNARFVGRLGMRRLSHTALLCYVGVGTILALLGFPADLPLAAFMAALAVLFFCFGLVAPNFNALSMEPLGQIAGMASSMIGCYTTIAGAVFGWLIGQSFDGSVRPLMIGFAVMGGLALLSVWITEGRRLTIGKAAAQPRAGE